MMTGLFIWAGMFKIKGIIWFSWIQLGDKD